MKKKSSKSIPAPHTPGPWDVSIGPPDHLTKASRAIKTAIPWMGQQYDDLTPTAKQQFHNAVEGMKQALAKVEGR